MGRAGESAAQKPSKREQHTELRHAHKIEHTKKTTQSSEGADFNHLAFHSKKNVLLYLRDEVPACLFCICRNIPTHDTITLWYMLTLWIVSIRKGIQFPVDVTWGLNSETVWQSIIQTLRSHSNCCLGALMDSLNTGAASYWNSPFVYCGVNSGRGTASLLISVVYFWRAHKCSVRPSTFTELLRESEAYQQVLCFSVWHINSM